MKIIKIQLILFLLSNVLAGQIKNIGIPLIKNFKKNEYKGGTQNWSIDQDKNGNMYFANTDGMLQFDGVTWTKFTLPISQDIRSLKIDPTGKIFVGGYNDFGYFKANPKGKLEYHSIAKFIKRNGTNSIAQTWKIHFYKNEVIFQAFKTIYVYKKNKISILKTPYDFQFSFKVKNRLFFQNKKLGLMEYRDGKLVPLKETTLLNNTEIWGMFTMPENKLLIATIDKGLFLYANNKLTQWKTEANEFVKKNNCLGGVEIKDNYIVLNSILNGMVLCDKKGRIIQHINKQNGLQNNTILSSFIDSNNNLWLGLDNGITFINENSHLTYFVSNYNLGTVYSSIVHEGNLYVATNQGVFYHPWNTNFKNDNFRFIEGTASQAWNLHVIGNELICASNKGALLIKEGKLIRNLSPKGYFRFIPIPNQPKYTIGANYNGFDLFEKTNSGLKFRNSIEGIHNSSNTFEIDNNYLWVKKDEYLYQIVLNNNLKNAKTIKTYSKLSNQNNYIGSIQKINNKIYFQSNNTFYNYSIAQKGFIEDPIISNLFKSLPKIKEVKEDIIGNLWCIFDESLGALMKIKDNKYKQVIAPFSNLTGNLVANYISINTVDSKNTFFGLTDGLAHYDSSIENKSNLKPIAHIRSFSFPGDTILLGNGQISNNNYKLPYASNQVKFTFSSPSYENLENLEFSYQLEGFDENWSGWSNSAIKEYTNLKESNYKMKVKVRNSYGIQSDETSIGFRVYPPWYRHSFAYLFYLLMAGALVYYIRLRIKIKIRKNKHFEILEQRRLYLEKETKIRQEQYELEKEIEKLENEKLQIKILTKDKELVNNTLQVVKKNKVLNGIIHKLKDININSFDEETKTQFTKLNRSITKEVKTDKSWKDLEKHLKNVHFDFLKKLKEKHPAITPREMDLSTYLLMNMSTKEIAEFMNISTGGVELARYRLRKKLELNKKENLIGYLMSIK
jgi:DNA-binding CsgD family transcriptional regulator